MSENHYFMTVHRDTAEKLLPLTWAEFSKRYSLRWWGGLGRFLDYTLHCPLLPANPTKQQVAPFRNWTIRTTLLRTFPSYSTFLNLTHSSSPPPLAEIITRNTPETLPDCDALNATAIAATKHNRLAPMANLRVRPAGATAASGLMNISWMTRR